MPQETLEYDSLISNSMGSSIEKVEDDDNVFAIAQAVGQLGQFELGNLTSSDIGVINWVKVYMKAYTSPAKRVAGVAVYLQDQSDTLLQTANFQIDSAVEALFDSGEIPTDGTSAWTETSVSDLRLTVRYLADISDPGGGSTDVYFDYIYLVVDYDIPVPPPYNNNRNRLHVANGRIDLTSGRLSI